eukprot:73475_1
MAVSQPINAILQDTSYFQVHGLTPADDYSKCLDDNKLDFDEKRILTHLQYTYDYLTKTNSNNNDTTKRNFHLSNLKNYIQSQQFPKHDAGDNIIHNSYRRPIICDKNGNLCAVAYLLKMDQQEEILSNLQKYNNYSYLTSDLLLQYPKLTQWINNSGLSAIEFASIQPTYGCSLIGPIHNSINKMGKLYSIGIKSVQSSQNLSISFDNFPKLSIMNNGVSFTFSAHIAFGKLSKIYNYKTKNNSIMKYINNFGYVSKMTISDQVDAILCFLLHWRETFLIPLIYISLSDPKYISKWINKDIIIPTKVNTFEEFYKLNKSIYGELNINKVINYHQQLHNFAMKEIKQLKINICKPCKSFSKELMSEEGLEQIFSAPLFIEYRFVLYQFCKDVNYEWNIGRAIGDYCWGEMGKWDLNSFIN